MSSRDLDSVKPARAWGRYWASTIDGLVFGLPAVFVPLFVFVLIGVKPTILQLVTNVWAKVWYFLLAFLYNWYYVSNNGATIGKDAYGFEVRSYMTGHRVDSRSAAIREGAKGILVRIPYAGPYLLLASATSIIFTKHKRGLYDFVASTQVVKVKKPWTIKRQSAFFALLVAAYLCGGYLFIQFVDF